MIHHTFTRGELTAALAAVDRPDIAEGIYSRRVEHNPAKVYGPRSLALDYDDPTDVHVLILAVTQIIGIEAGIGFAVSTDVCLPGHPADPGPRGARWLGWVLGGEPTVEEWQDEVNSCPCSRDPEDQPCPYGHDRAPWERPAAGGRKLTAVPS